MPISYPIPLSVSIADRPIEIQLKWPAGTYGLIRSTSGCPVGFYEGFIKQDNEDSNNGNSFTINPLASGYSFSNYVSGDFGSDLKLYYCVKQYNDDSRFDWPAGRYCIAKKNRCPSGFHEGEIFWDDEDLFNRNERNGVLPDGTYDRDTRIKYCCRNDGDVNYEICLPTERPFILYQFHQRGCQKVSGMDIREISMRTDDEDIANRNACSGEYPFIDGGCNDNLKVMACFYSK